MGLPQSSKSFVDLGAMQAAKNKRVDVPMDELAK